MKKFNKKNFLDSLIEIGIKKGDIIFSHSNIGFFGYPEEGNSKEIIFRIILDSFLELLGKEGAIIVPTFTYSFCRNEIYNVQVSPSTSGIFTEMIRQHSLAIRSLDPIFSVASIGDAASSLLNNVAEECFGVDSFWDRFYKAQGKFVNMNMDAGNTFIHYVERSLNVPYRFNKTFYGMIKNETELYESQAIYFVRDMAKPHDEPDFKKFDKGFCKNNDFVKSAKIGRGIILSFSARDVFSFIKQNLNDDPKFLIKGIN